jgi:hypothetical protein
MYLQPFLAAGRSLGLIKFQVHLALFHDCPVRYRLARIDMYHTRPFGLCAGYDLEAWIKVEASCFQDTFFALHLRGSV